MHNVRVNLGERSYDIQITTGDVSGLGLFARERLPSSECRGLAHPSGQAVIVADRNVAGHVGLVAASLSAAGFHTTCVEIPPGEAQKSLERAAHLYDALVEVGANRRTLVVALGG